MGATTPDGLPWPPGYAGVPADVPNDIQKLATATQTALNKKLAYTMTSGTIARASGWVGSADHYGEPVVWRNGKMVFAAGMFRRSENLTIESNTGYELGTVADGFRPNHSIRAALSWSVQSGSEIQFRVSQVAIYTDGTITFISSANGTFRAVNDFISLGGLSWVTP